MITSDIVIIGAGIAGLSTALALHRLGIQSTVLESSDSLRTAGFAIFLWLNAWKALDALAVGHHLRCRLSKIQRLVVTSLDSSHIIAERSLMHEARCVKRSLLLEALLKDLPNGTVRYSSKVISIEESGHFKLLHLADGTVVKTKVLIGCDGVNSVVAKWLGFKDPAFTGRYAVRALVDFKNDHGFGTKFLQFNGEGVRSGFIPCDAHTIYWFFSWTPTKKDKQVQESPTAMKRFVLNKLNCRIPSEVKNIIEKTPLRNMIVSPLRCRQPWELFWRCITKGNVCVAGDALHAMTPDLGQGGCASLEDGIILARCISEALKSHESPERIEMGLKRFAKERRWRSFELICTAYVVGLIQQSKGKIMEFLRDRSLAGLVSWLMVKNTSFECGKL